MSNESLIRLLEHYRITYQLDKLKLLKKELTANNEQLLDKNYEEEA